MNFLETKRLVRKIGELLHEQGDAAMAPKLAQDFVAACRAVTVRLNQCEAMISSSEEMQALQLAETSPNLMDLLAALEFREAAAWRKYCREHDLPVAETFDERAVHKLNDCYARGINTDHPLYRDYRRAMVLKDDEAALTVLRTIGRINASDSNARSELARLDRKVLSERLAALGRLLDSGSPDKIARAVSDLESSAFQNSPAGEIWSRAQTIRCGVLLDDITADQQRDDWRSALDRLDFIANLQRDWTFSIDTAAQSRFSELSAWAEGERYKDEQDRLFKRLLVRLGHLVNLSEEKEIAAREIELPELKADLEELQKTWRAIEQFARSVPTDLTASYRKRVALLQAEVSRRVRMRVRNIAIGVTAALLLIAGTTWMFQQHLKRNDFVRQLQQAREKRLVRTGEKLVAQARETDRGLASKSGVMAELTATETFLKREQGVFENFQAMLKGLPSNVGALASADELKRTQQQLLDTTNLLAQLAPDLRAEGEPKLAMFRDAWARHLFERGAELSKGFENALRQNEELASRMNFSQPVSAVRAEAVSLGGELAKLSEQRTDFAPVVPGRGDLLQRLKELQDKQTAFVKELASFDAAWLSATRAQSATEFNEAVAALSRSEFSSAPEVRAAAGARDLEFSAESLLRSLLCGGNDALWNHLKNSTGSEFMPKGVMPAEKKHFLELKNEDAINPELYSYSLRLTVEPPSSVTWITEGKLNKSEQVWSKVRVFTPGSSATSFGFGVAEYGWFDGRYVLPGNQSLQEIRLIGPCTETKSFFTLRLPELVALHNDTYQFPLLKTLDELKVSREDSPLFRAYLFLRLCEFMELQPEGWGVPFSPSLAADRARLASAGGAEVRSGDWYVPARNLRLSGSLQKFFEQASGISYWEQAQTVSKIYRGVLAAGVRYAGFADASGKLQPNASGARELWGWSAETRKPAVLAVKTASDWKLVSSALPCSPLFAFGEDRAALLAKAGAKPGDPVLDSALPVVFRATNSKTK